MRIPYALIPAVDLQTRHAQIFHAIQREIPRLRPTPINPAAMLSLACYGPSLADTWEILRDRQRAGQPILSMSGATHFLADRGVIPDFHVDMDPRAHKVKHLDPVVPGVHYLMASVCPPSTWDLLRDAHVSLWHCMSNRAQTPEFLRQHETQFPVVILQGGSTIGLTALHLGGLLGYQRFEIHGMDGSFAPDRTTRHAGPHYGPTHHKYRVTWDAGGVTYHSTQIMANAVAETLNTFQVYPMIGIFYGTGLTQALIRESGLENACCADDEDRVARLRASRVELLVTPPITAKTTRSLWDVWIDALPPSTVPDLLAIIAAAEPRRRAASYNTGSIPLETALELRALSHHYQPACAVEIGTFIGTSTAAIAADELHTCDRDNDCLPATPPIRTYPRQSSTEMLTALAADPRRRVDFFFFDGRIQFDDVPLIQQLAHARTVYAFDDVVEGQKGTANLERLQSLLQQHVFVAPNPRFAGRSSLAAMIPLERHAV